MDMINTIIFPMRFPVHIGFVVISIILLLILYAKKRYAYHMLMMIGIASTLLVYLCANNILLTVLGVEEFVILILVIAGMVKAGKAKSAAESEKKPSESKE